MSVIRVNDINPAWPHIYLNTVIPMSSVYRSCRISAINSSYDSGDLVI